MNVFTFIKFGIATAAVFFTAVVVGAGYAVDSLASHIPVVQTAFRIVVALVLFHIACCSLIYLGRINLRLWAWEKMTVKFSQLFWGKTIARQLKDQADRKAIVDAGYGASTPLLIGNMCLWIDRLTGSQKR